MYSTPPPLPPPRLLYIKDKLQLAAPLQALKIAVSPATPTIPGPEGAGDAILMVMPLSDDMFAAAVALVADGVAPRKLPEGARC